MPTLITTECRRIMGRQGGFNAFYSALLLLTFHWSTVLYINSSYLEQFVEKEIMGALFIGSSLLTIIAFLYASPLLTRLGNVRLTLVLTFLEFAALLGMAYAQTPLLAVSLFVIHQMVVPILMFNLDIFMEELIGEKEGTTGKRRGLYLALASLTGALASLGMGMLVGTGTPNFALAYTASALMLIPFLVIISAYFKNFQDPHYPPLQVLDGIKTFWSKLDVRNVFFAHFLLQLFFAGMVIYTPLYLADVIGFNWEQIGVIIFAGLMAYVFLEYPIGYIADTYIGEKEMMAFGFAVIAIATSWFIFLNNSSLLVWMIAMFMTRVGASFVETTTESYFFKHTQGEDANVIGLFRITRPLSYVLGAFLGGLILHFLSYEVLFLLLGIAMIPGMFFAMALHDTK